MEKSGFALICKKRDLHYRIAKAWRYMEYKEAKECQQD